MTDFLRSNTWCSQEEYKWGMTVAQIRLSSQDFTRVEYLSEKEKDKRKSNASRNVEVIHGAADLKRGLNDFGLPIINRKK